MTITNTIAHAEVEREVERRSASPKISPASERLAARGDMRELVVRAALHRARLGDPGGVASARMLAEATDNAALQAEVAAAV